MLKDALENAFRITAKWMKVDYKPSGIRIYRV